MAKRSTENQEEERKRELIRTLRRGPNLDQYITEQKRTFISYAQGAQMYSIDKFYDAMENGRSYDELFSVNEKQYTIIT